MSIDSTHKTLSQLETRLNLEDLAAKAGWQKPLNFNGNQFFQVEKIDSTWDKAAANFGVSIAKIHRYARLAELCEGLLFMADRTLSQLETKLNLEDLAAKSGG